MNPGHNQEPYLKYITNLSTLTNLSSYYLQSKPVTSYNFKQTGHKQVDLQTGSPPPTGHGHKQVDLQTGSPPPTGH